MNSDERRSYSIPDWVPDSYIESCGPYSRDVVGMSCPRCGSGIYASHYYDAFGYWILCPSCYQELNENAGNAPVTDYRGTAWVDEEPVDNESFSFVGAILMFMLAFLICGLFNIRFIFALLIALVICAIAKVILGDGSNSEGENSPDMSGNG